MTLQMREDGSGMMEPLGATQTGKVKNQIIGVEKKSVLRWGDMELNGMIMHVTTNIMQSARGNQQA